MVELMTVSVLLAVVLGVLLLWVLRSSSGRQTSESGVHLPKGSMGWPIVGESISFAADPMAYAYARIKRYGRTFKSSLLFMNCIVCTTQDFTRFVLTNTNKFKGGYISSMVKLTGERAFMFQEGRAHTSIKKIYQTPLTVEYLRQHVGQIHTIVADEMATWAKRGSVITEEECKKISFYVSMSLVIGVQDARVTAEGRLLLEQFKMISEASVSMPVDIPGTAMHNGLKARAKLGDYLLKLVQERRSDGNKQLQSDVLGHVLLAQADPQLRELESLNDDVGVVDNLVSLLVGAYDTSTTSMIWVVKLLLDHPDVFRAIMAEQEEIFSNKDRSQEAKLTWEDTKKMVYASKFINELLRYVPITFMVVRKAVEDVQYNGINIPKGWAVPMMISCVHKDPEVFPDPLTFNPSRFDTTPKPYTFLPFGSGVQLCPGSELVKLVMLIFIHELTTKYRWESAAPDKGIIWNCFPRPRGGYPVNIKSK